MKRSSVDLPLLCALLLLLLLGAALVACVGPHYKIVKEAANGGEVALDAKEDAQGRTDAEAYMKNRCGRGGYEVKHEHAQAGAGAFRGGDSTWRIEYECKPPPVVEEEKSDAGWKP